MMNTVEVSVPLGISLKALRRAIRKSGLRYTLTKRGAEYLSSSDDLDAVSQYLGRQRAVPKIGEGTPEGRTDDEIIADERTKSTSDVQQAPVAQLDRAHDF